jgi:hypothetical protein
MRHPNQLVPGTDRAVAVDPAMRLAFELHGPVLAALDDYSPAVFVAGLCHAAALFFAHS